ncbi:MAG: hypothetical protein AB7O38_14170, partial [Pirellulaceae bacterium]
DSRDVRIYCMYGNVRQLGERPMLEVVNSDQILVTQLKAFAPSRFPHLIETRGADQSVVPSTAACALFLRGL